ncbi:MAG: hypothetical protein Barrevirus11_9 [Barrevirus sp.]|uniref:Uncharacterized protein n=1 Tax=Barrevirus sp. TaxID=2487763 RepID=A0A3G4ZUI0_9VIRU|nr:MAG: hypothetical protein Barrevirus11_9 [Barrevirus sp.]
MEKPEVNQLNIVAQKYYLAIKDDPRNRTCQLEQFSKDLNLPVYSKCNNTTQLDQFLCKYHIRLYCKRCSTCNTYISGSQKCCLECKCLIDGCNNLGRRKKLRNEKDTGRYCSFHSKGLCHFCGSLNCVVHACIIKGCNSDQSRIIPGACNEHLCHTCKNLYTDKEKTKREGEEEKEVWSKYSLVQTVSPSTHTIIHIIDKTTDNHIDIKNLDPYYGNNYHDRQICPNHVKPCLSASLGYKVSDTCTKYIPILNSIHKLANDVLCLACKNNNLCQNAFVPDRKKVLNRCKNYYAIETSTETKRYCDFCTTEKVCQNKECDKIVNSYYNDYSPDRNTCSNCSALGIVCHYCNTLHNYNSYQVKYAQLSIFKHIVYSSCFNCLSDQKDTRCKVSALIISWKFYAKSFNNYVNRLKNELNYKGSIDFLTLVFRVLDITADQKISVFRATIKVLCSINDQSIQTFLDETALTPSLNHQCLLLIATVLPRDIMLLVLNLIFEP